MKAVTLLLILSTLLLASCKTIEQPQAEAIAKSFVQARVIPYTAANDSRDVVAEYQLSILNSNRVGDNWHMNIEISSMHNGTKKRTTVPVTVDARSGRVTEFNNMPVTQR